MRFKLVESILLEDNVGYHYGDLGKADKRSIMAGRGTGHFGTGTYFFGSPDSPGSSYYKKNRPENIVDFSSYKLFKPMSNKDGYRLHDFLKSVNEISFLLEYGKIQLNWIDFIPYNKREKIFDDLQELLDLNDEDIDDTFIDDIDDVVDIPDNISLDTIDDVEKYIKDLNNRNKGLSEGYLNGNIEKAKDFILKYGNDSMIPKSNDFDDYYEVCKNIQKEIDDFAEDYEDDFRNAKYIFNLSEDSIIQKVKNAAKQIDSYDSASTVFMKSLGYGGIDVRHLNKDSQGLSGLDNSGYGSVIYDIKPETIVTTALG